MNQDSLRSMGNAKNVKILLLNCETLTSESFTSWTEFKNLQVLDLSASNLQEADLKHLQNFPSLRVLNLPAHQKITADVIPVLQKNPQLFKLNIIGTSILPKDLGDKYTRPGHWDYDL